MRNASINRALASVVLLSAGVVQAANVSWDGGAGADRDWDNGLNWSGSPDNTKPTTIDQARILGNTEATAAQLLTAQTVQQLRVGTGSSGFLEISNDLTVTDTSESNSAQLGVGTTGKIVQTAGTLAVGGGFFIGHNGSGNGTYNLSGGSLTANYMFVGRGGSGAVGVVNQTGGTVTLNDGGDALRLGAVAGASGTYNISGGSVSATRMVIGAEGNATTTGTMVVSGAAVVTAANALNLGVDATGLLELRGSKTGSGTDVTVSNDRFTWTKGVVSAIPGTLRALIDDAAITTPSAMRAVNTKAITINPGSLLDVGFLPGTTPGDGTWTVLKWTGTDPVSANVAFAPGVALGWSMNFDNTANILTVTYAAVPEPASVGFATIATGTMLVRRRRVQA